MNNPLIHTKNWNSKEPNVIYGLTISALILFYLFDGANKILVTYNFPFTRASIIIRVVYELIFLFVIIRYINNFRIFFLVTTLCFFFCFVTGQIVFSNAVAYTYDLTENIIIFNKYFFIFIIYFSIYKLKNYPLKLNHCINVLENIFVINSIAILVGVVTGLEFLKSYVGMDYRYGYMGLIPAQNEATLFYFIAVSFAYYKRFELGIRSKKFYLIVIPAMLLGTKGIYVFFILLLLFHFIYYATNLTRILTLIVASIGIIKIIEFVTSEKGRALLYFFYDSIEKKGWLSMLLTGRDDSVNTDVVAVVDKWNIFNYLFGGQDQNLFLTEMDIFDVFLFFGIMGSLVYLLLIFNTLFQVKAIYPFYVFFVGCFFLLAFLGGHFFSSAVNSLYLCLVGIFFYVSREPDYLLSLKKLEELAGKK